MNRREQKVSLAQLLFSEDDDCEDKGPSEVYVEQVDGDEDRATLKHRRDRLAQARAALRLSLLLREAACTSLSLSELCKRRLTYSGKAGAKEALRCADKALEIAGDGFWDGDEIAIEVSRYFVTLLHSAIHERESQLNGFMLTYNCNRPMTHQRLILSMKGTPLHLV